MGIISHIAAVALALLVAAYLIPGVHIDGLGAAVIGAVVLGLLNALVRPVVTILTLPITILTLGLFIFVINATMFLVAAAFIDGFTVDTFFDALLGSFTVSVVSTVLLWFLP